MSMSWVQRLKAHTIIHAASAGAGTVSAIVGLIPVIGPVTGDSISLVSITATMCTLLSGAVFDRDLDKNTWVAALKGGIFQFVIGAIVINSLSSFIPILGSAVNATVSVATVEVIGWGTCRVLEEGGDPSALWGEKIKELMFELFKTIVHAS